MPNAPSKLKIPAAWLLNIRPNGTCAFKALAAVEYQSTGSPGESCPIRLTLGISRKLSLLRHEMQRELVKAGLFKDEADALLNTWQVSYFQSPGSDFFSFVSASHNERLASSFHFHALRCHSGHDWTH